jgi:hypothetical protein
VGAFFSAMRWAASGLLLAMRDAATPYLVVFAVLPLLVDVLLTLIVRARRGAAFPRRTRSIFTSSGSSHRPARTCAGLRGLGPDRP